MSDTASTPEPIPVRFPLFSELSFTYDSARAAIRGTQQTERHVRAKADAQLIKNAVVEHVVWLDREVWFGLSNQRALRVYLRGDFTEWQVLDLRGGISLPAEGRSLDSPPQKRVAVGSEAVIPYEWRGSELLRARKGAALTGLFAGHVWLHVYFESLLSITFLAQERTDTGEVLLDWWEDD